MGVESGKRKFSDCLWLEPWPSRIKIVKSSHYVIHSLTDILSIHRPCNIQWLICTFILEILCNKQNVQFPPFLILETLLERLSRPSLLITNAFNTIYTQAGRRLRDEHLMTDILPTLCGHCWEGPGAACPHGGPLVHQGQWLAGILFGPAQQCGLQRDGAVKSQI